jgi:hypothetical protein
VHPDPDQAGFCRRSGHDARLTKVGTNGTVALLTSKLHSLLTTPKRYRRAYWRARCRSIASNPPGSGCTTSAPTSVGRTDTDWYSPRTPPLGLCRLRPSAIVAAGSFGGVHGKTQSLVPGCISGWEHVGRVRNGCRSCTGPAPECRHAFRVRTVRLEIDLARCNVAATGRKTLDRATIAILVRARILRDYCLRGQTHDRATRPSVGKAPQHAQRRQITEFRK